jgi:hypothetical protein
MFVIRVVCSDPDCAEESEVFVEELDEADSFVCGCEHCVIVLSVAELKPIHAIS